MRKYLAWNRLQSIFNMRNLLGNDDTEANEGSFGAVFLNLAERCGFVLLLKIFTQLF